MLADLVKFQNRQYSLDKEKVVRAGMLCLLLSPTIGRDFSFLALCKNKMTVEKHIFLSTRPTFSFGRMWKKFLSKVNNHANKRSFVWKTLWICVEIKKAQWKTVWKL